MKPERDAQIMIEEGLDEYWYEDIVRPQEEREMMKAYDKHLKKIGEKKYEIKKQIIQDYMKQDQHDICNRCFIGECRLMDEVFGCGYIGKKLKLEDDLDEESIKYKIVDMPKGVWDEIFVPLTDEQINAMTAIF